MNRRLLFFLFWAGKKKTPDTIVCQFVCRPLIKGSVNGLIQITSISWAFCIEWINLRSGDFFYEWIIPVIPRKREQFVFSPRFFVPSSFIQHLLVLSSSWLLNKDDWSTTKASYPHSWHPCLRKAWYSGYWFLKAEIPAPVLRSRNALATCHLHWEVTWPMLSLNNDLESCWYQK